MATLDPRIGLATALGTQHGVYALLIGSGVSTGAGIPTGWGVVADLARRAAVAAGEEPGPEFDAVAWWAANGDGQPLGYSNLLRRLADTGPARRALLAQFFEPTDADREAGLKVPGPAHEAIAALVRKGVIRVIVTTNFDRLLERAIEAEGISPQVISSESAVSGMEPMQHMPCTILKVHGDYASLDQRNTEEELSAYPPAIDSLLNRIFDEYGLIVSGWSGDWDPALVAALQGSANRRYPLYWTSRSALGETGRRVTARSGVHVIQNVSADDFFPDLLQRFEAVESMKDTPESINTKVARLKRALPDPTRHLDLRDLLEAELNALSEYLADYAAGSPPKDMDEYQQGFADARGAAMPLLRLFTTGVLLDRDRQHTDLWVWALERAMNARPRTDTESVKHDLTHYPAMLLLRGGVIAALLANRENVARRLLQQPKWAHRLFDYGTERSRPAWDVLEPEAFLIRDHALQLPRFRNTRKLWPMSRMIREDLHEVIEPLTGGQDYERLHNRAEYRAALAWLFAETEDKQYSVPPLGEFILDRYWTRDSPSQLLWDKDFVANGDLRAWRYLPSERGIFLEQLGELREELRRHRRR